MPELPEVETVVRQLDRVLPSRVIESVEVLREKSAQSDLGKMAGKKVARVTRKQKMIVVEFEESDLFLVIHLKMTGQLIFVSNQDDSPTPGIRKSTVGQLIFDPSDVSTTPSSSPLRRGRGERVVGGHPSLDWVGELPSRHTRVIVHFNDGSTLFFNDQRVFGWMKIIQNSKFKIQSEQLPPDVVDPEFTADYLRQVLKKSGRAIKLVILDQAKMGGMGNIYANDALWLAGIRPAKRANTLAKKQIKALHEAMVQVIHRAIVLGGSSYSDYVDTKGMGGKYQDEFLVYDREGERCRKEGCGGVIEKLKIGGRGTYWCRGCQR